MRRAHLTDLNIATRVLLAAPAEDHQDIAQKLIRNAHTADKYRKKTGRAHPIWGAGSLADACMGHIKAPLLKGCDAGYLACLSTVVAGLCMK
ncbi:MAG: hypothetical protein ACI9HB_001377 [Gammaproteobacteria bacterium]|jgi:hypothetical protein